MENRNVPAVFSLMLLLSLLYALGKAVYNIYFHPLRSFPGPLAARAGSFWYVRHVWAGQHHARVKELHDKYGEVVRIAPSELSFNASQAWQEIYGYRSAKRDESYQKDPTTYRATWGNPDLITASDENHRRLRRLQAHAFSEKALGSQADIIDLYISKLISTLHEKARFEETAVVDMVNWYNFATFDLIGDLAFGESFGCLDLGLLHPWIRCLFGYVRMTFLYQAFARIHPLLALFANGVIYRSLANDKKNHLGYSVGLARKRIATKTDRPDFMSYILKHNDEKGMTGPELESASSLLVVAGSETTGTVLAGATFHLLKNPSTLTKLTREIRTSFQKEKDITINSTAPLSYLHAVIEESLRMVPPVATGLPRISPPDRAVMVCGKVIPPGTAIGINHWSTYMAEHNFRDPKNFVPERWLGDCRFINDDKKSFQPFSFGPRNCLGKNLAYVEMRMILARMIWNFDMELQEDSLAWDKKTKNFIIWDKVSMHVRLSPVIR
ncbi:hypothetical protein MMC29_008437 [Sticta canariensis]|nr:hypothetical protein [Sticta canariensis]